MIKLDPALYQLVTIFAESNDVARILLDAATEAIPATDLEKDFPTYIGFSNEEGGKLTYIHSSKVPKGEDPWHFKSRIKTTPGKLINKIFGTGLKNKYRIFDVDIENFGEIVKQMDNINKPKVSDKKTYEKFAGKLKKTLKIQSYSREETPMINYIVGVLRGIPGVKFNVIEEGGGTNIYAWKGTPAEVYPCVVAHTDTVHKIIPQFNVFRIKDHFFSMGDKDQTGIGGDDKVGVFMALEMLKQFPSMKACFFWGEEIGCLGSRASEKGFFDDVGYILQADRKGSSDVIRWGDYTQLFDDDFQTLITPLMSKYNYHVESGSWTDVVALKRSGIDVAMFNFSCGYNNPHSEKEIISIRDCFNSYNFCTEVIKLLGEKKYAHSDLFKFDGEFGDVNKFIGKTTCEVHHTPMKVVKNEKDLTLKCPKCEPEANFKYPIMEESAENVVKIALAEDLVKTLEKVKTVSKKTGAVKIAKLFLTANKNGIDKTLIAERPINFISFSRTPKKLSFKGYEKEEFETFLTESKSAVDTTIKKKNNTLPGIATRIWNPVFIERFSDFWQMMEEFETEFFEHKIEGVAAVHYSEND